MRSRLSALGFPRRDERSVGAVPRAVVGALCLALMLQIGWRFAGPAPTARAEALPAPPPEQRMMLLAFGDPVLLAKLSMLWLQAFDNQPGVSLPFRELDYTRVAAWLDRILALDPRGQYPLLAATRLYGEVRDPPRQRLMLEFAYRHFLEDPNRRWQWVAHCVFIAKHRLEDLDLALKYARALTEHATGPEVPSWAKQMQIFVLEDMGEIESAKVLLGGLLEEGAITDPNELRFLERRLQEIEEAHAP
jgi:hypothetical protein